MASNQPKGWAYATLLALALVIAGCADSTTDAADDAVAPPQPTEAELRALVNDAIANPMSESDYDAYNLRVADESNDNKSLANHFYVTTEEERASAQQTGYQFEGQTGSVFATGGEGRVPLYRVFREKNTDHFYTTNEEERDLALEQGFVDEGNAGYIYPADGPERQPLYRLFNVALSDHFYTTDKAERDTLAGDKEWADEGVAGYLPTSGNDLLPFYRLYQAAPAAICEGGLDEDEREALFGIVISAVNEDRITPSTLNSLSESLIEDYGCDYGVNANLLTRWGENGVVEIDFPQLAGLIEQQTAEMDLTPAQTEALDLTVESLEQAGTQLVPYSEGNNGLNYPDLNSPEAIVAVTANFKGDLGLSACSGGGICFTPDGTLIIDGGPIPLGLTISDDALTLTVDKGVFTDAIPGINFNVGVSATFQEADSFLNLITPDSTNLFIDAGSCLNIACFGGSGGFEIRDIPQPGDPRNTSLGTDIVGSSDTFPHAGAVRAERLTSAPPLASASPF